MTLNITAAETLSLVTAHGATALFHTDTTSYSATTGLTTRGTPVTHTVYVLEEKRASRIPNDAGAVIYCSPSELTVTPFVGQLVDYKGQHWTIGSVGITAYQGTTILYTIALTGVTP